MGLESVDPLALISELLEIDAVVPGPLPPHLTHVSSQRGLAANKWAKHKRASYCQYSDPFRFNHYDVNVEGQVCHTVTVTLTSVGSSMPRSLSTWGVPRRMGSSHVASLV